MKYENIVPGIFQERPNRFIAYVDINGNREIVHVKNTGRCKELLTPGTLCWCECAINPQRKTKFDLIAVQKGERIINIDSQAPNAAAYEWLKAGGLGFIPDQINPEFVYGQSRIDFMYSYHGRIGYVEVKGVTLEFDNHAFFPDAPTERGSKHLRELVKIKQAGFDAAVLFVIQMQSIITFSPNIQTDPIFTEELRNAERAGVQILARCCSVTPKSMIIAGDVPVAL